MVCSFATEADTGLLAGSTEDAGDRDRSHIAFRIDYLSESRVLVTRFCASVDTHAAWDSLEAIAKEVSCRPVEGVLFDIRYSEYAARAADARAFAAYLISFLGRRRFAFLTRSMTQNELARTVAADARAGGVSVEEFQDEQQAAWWLCSCDRS